MAPSPGAAAGDSSWICCNARIPGMAFHLGISKQSEMCVWIANWPPVHRWCACAHELRVGQAETSLVVDSLITKNGFSAKTVLAQNTDLSEPSLTVNSLFSGPEIPGHQKYSPLGLPLSQWNPCPPLPVVNYHTTTFLSQLHNLPLYWYSLSKFLPFHRQNVRRTGRNRVPGTPLWQFSRLIPYITGVNSIGNVLQTILSVCRQTSRVGFVNVLLFSGLFAKMPATTREKRCKFKLRQSIDTI